MLELLLLDLCPHSGLKIPLFLDVFDSALWNDSVVLFRVRL
jgi:hypothetical protein